MSTVLSASSLSSQCDRPTLCVYQYRQSIRTVSFTPVRRDSTGRRVSRVFHRVDAPNAYSRQRLENVICPLVERFSRQRVSSASPRSQDARTCSGQSQSTSTSSPCPTVVTRLTTSSSTSTTTLTSRCTRTETRSLPTPPQEGHTFEGTPARVFASVDSAEQVERSWNMDVCGDDATGRSGLLLSVPEQAEPGTVSFQWDCQALTRPNE
jgi:hypothetical protein